MYRKILFISINFLNDIEILTKAVLLLFFSAISVLLTLFYKPFVFQEINNLELYSNIAVCATVFSGALYVQNIINDNFRAFIFFGILFVNIWFSIFWVWSCFELFLDNHFNMLFKHFPRFTKKVVALHEAISTTNFNIIKYASKMFSTTRTIVKEYHENTSVFGASTSFLAVKNFFIYKNH
jgi:hypothetical protein